METIKYKKRHRYKYTLAEVYECATGFDILKDIGTAYVTLKADGSMIIMQKYSWDGPSGPTIDTRNFMRGSLVHDALYQLMREGLLNIEYRNDADLLLRKMSVQDKMSRIRAWWVYWAVRLFARGSAESDLWIAP